MPHSSNLPRLSTLALALALLGLAACSSAKYAGPSDDVIRQQVGDTLKADSAGSEQNINFRVTQISHEDVFESDGARGIPKGTLIFRIICKTTMKEGTEAAAVVPLVIFFYKDGSGVWKSFTKE
jgi:hypothetical protein